MKIKIGNTEIEAKTLEVVAPIEYWEDCEVRLRYGENYQLARGL